MSDPVRLRDDADQNAELRSDLTVASETAPVAYDAGAGLERFLRAITPSLPPGNASAASGANAGSSGFSKWWWGLAPVGLASAALWFGLAADEPTRLDAALPPAASIVALEPKPPPAKEPSRRAERVEQARPSVAQSSAPPTPSGSRFAEEVAHLAELRRVAARDPARAASMADEGHARFRGGVFYQEREAIAVSALAAAGRTGDARRRAQAFANAYPNSPLVDRVRRAGGLPNE